MIRTAPVIPRFLQEVVANRLTDEPVIVIHGARTVGKSTLLRHLADRLGTQVLDLDDLATRQAATADVQAADGRVAGVEVKFGSRVTSDDMKGLRSLRTLLGARFVGGVVLSTGPHAYHAEEGLHVVPLDRLWS